MNDASELHTDSQGSERWHTVTTDSPTIYVWDDFKGETAKSRAQGFARDIGPQADYHREGSEDCEVWGCMAHLAPLYDANLRNSEPERNGG